MESRLGGQRRKGSGHDPCKHVCIHRYRRQRLLQPSQAVTEQSNVQVYGNAAVVVGTFRVKGTEKGKPYVHRERFVDTWIKINGTWQCVATTGTLIAAKPGAN